MANDSGETTSTGLGGINTVVAIRDHGRNELQEAQTEVEDLKARLRIARARVHLLEDIIEAASPGIPSQPTPVRV